MIGMIGGVLTAVLVLVGTTATVATIENYAQNRGAETDEQRSARLIQERKQKMVTQYTDSIESQRGGHSN